jgi:hypothetical protein
MRRPRSGPPERGIAPPTRTVPPDHFSTGVWATRGPLGLRQYSCVLCGNRTTTWALFLVHRLVCRDRAVWERSEGALSDD